MCSWNWGKLNIADKRDFTSTWKNVIFYIKKGIIMWYHNIFWQSKWICIGCMLLSYHIRFQSESTLYSCLNLKKLLARNRRDIWDLSDNNGIRTHNHFVRKRTLNHLVKLAKWLSCVVSTYRYGAFVFSFVFVLICIIMSRITYSLRDMILTYSQMVRTVKYSQHSSII